MRSDPKSLIREAVLGYCEKFIGSGGRILDLWGGGESARLLAASGHNWEIISAERDKRLWPALRMDASRYGYTPHFGDITTVKLEPRMHSNRADFVWLDFCGFLGQEQWDTIKRFSGSRMAVTLMGARDAFKTVRPFAIPVSLIIASLGKIDLALRYPRAKYFMYFFILSNGGYYDWEYGIDTFLNELGGIAGALDQGEVWVRDWGGGSRKLRDCLPREFWGRFRDATSRGAVEETDDYAARKRSHARTIELLSHSPLNQPSVP